MKTRRDAVLALADGRVFHGLAFGHHGTACGEVCFNTSMTGYQEILTDPSYTDQIIVFTYPHIGNVGINPDDMESSHVHARGIVVRSPSLISSNYRAQGDLEGWLKSQQVVGICDIDTRALTRHLRLKGAVNGVIASDGTTVEDAVAMARAWHGIQGRDLVGKVSVSQAYRWTEGSFDLDARTYRESAGEWNVVVLDFGCKRSILRRLADRDCRLTVLPATTDAREILAKRPDGILLSNGPGDPQAVHYAVATIKELLRTDVPIFGICMGHQLLSRALGLRTFKLKFGHRGGNHPVKEIESGKVEITSQNHGFAVEASSLPANVEVTHVSLFDGTIEGLRLTDRPVFSVQYHPEASPGPRDADSLFDRFVSNMRAAR